MNATSLPSSRYFKRNGNITYDQALNDVLKDIQVHKDAYYVYAILLKLKEDDECKPLKYVDALKEGMQQGSILCQIMIGILKQQGKVIERHPIQAKKMIDTHLKSLESLAYEEDMYALGLLGFMHTHGLFVEKNIQTAMRYFHQAIKLEFVDAYHQLGYLYQLTSPYQDIQKGQSYVKIALDANYAPTWFAKGIQALKEKKLDEATQYLEKASLLGNIHAMFTLGTLYETQKQHQKGFEYFLKAATHNHIKGMYMTGLAYQSGKGVLKDESKGIDFMIQAAEHDDILALFHVANMELKKPNPNIERVYDYLYKAALKQHPVANHQLASMYEVGKYMLKDVKTALSFYERAIVMQFPPSLYQAAKILVEGVYVAKNIQKAIQYLEMAAEKKYKPAILMLETLKHKSEKKAYTA